MRAKTRGRKLFSLLLACMMVLSLVPTTAFAAYVGLSTENKSGTGWDYDAASKTLTLDGYDGSDIFYKSSQDLTINLVNDNAITLNGSQYTGRDFTGISVPNGNLNIKGDGTLNLVMDMADTDISNGLYGVNAKKITIEGKATVNVSISSTYRYSRVKGVLNAREGIEVKDAAEINVNIALAGSADTVYAVATSGESLTFSGTGNKTITTTDTAEYTTNHYLLFNGGSAGTESSGNIIITGTGKTTLNANRTGYGIYSDESTGGVISIDGTTVEINGGRFGVVNTSDARTSAAADVVVKNSTLSITDTEQGIGSGKNGIELNNSTVNISTTTNSGIHLNNVGNGTSSYNNESNHQLKVYGGKPVVIESKNDSPIHNKYGDFWFNTFELSEGGSIVLRGEGQLAQFASSLKATLGSNTIVTKGRIEGDVLYGEEDGAGNVEFKAEYSNSSGTVVDAETPTINSHPSDVTYTQGDTANALIVSASVSDGGTLSYQWYKDGSIISGATASSYTPDISKVGTADYYCVVTNMNSSATGNQLAAARSNTATVTVNHLHDWATDEWEMNDTHHWHKCTAEGCDTTDISLMNGYGEHVYDDSIDTTCNTCGYTRVHAAAPVIITQPESKTCMQYSDEISIFVNAYVSDGGTVSYQWYKNGTAIDGATEYDYSPDTDTVGTEAYYCVVTNTNNGATGRKITSTQSDTVTITVTEYIHTHDWSVLYYGNETHHWQKCMNSHCDLTDITQYEGYGEHVYDDDADTTCNICGHMRAVTPPPVHTCEPELVAKVEPTHFTEGKEAYYTCTCGKYYEDAAGTVEIADITTWGIIPVTDHVMSDWKHDETGHWKECTIERCTHKTTVEAHVYDDDADTTCNTCGYVRTITPPVHTCEPELVAKVEPTHFAEGKKAYYHCDCGKNYEDAAGTVEIADITTWGIIPVTDHEMSGWKHDETGHWKECTIEGCTHKAEEGAHVYDDDADTTCNTCGYERTVTPPHTHDFGTEWKHDDANHWHECECGNQADKAAHIPGPDATEDTPQTCTVCGHVIKAALGHVCANNLTLTEKKEATHFEEGKEAYYSCTCGKYYEDAAGTVEIEDIDAWGIIPKTDHVASEWMSDENNHWHECTIEGCDAKTEPEAHRFGWVIDREATETEAGSKHEECSVCGYKKAAVEIPAAGSGAGQDTPKTGDNGMMLMWILLLFVSLGGAAGVTVLKRKGLARK